jgi:NAD(P)-dependent dehydrogenase (short-subunit alcohol dehydrogenase family)
LAPPVKLVPGTAIVTGGGSGIGKAIALALAEAGAPVAIVDVLPEGGRAVRDDIARSGGKSLFIGADVSRWDDVDRAVMEAVRGLGPLGIMVNAAGILDGYAPIHELSPAVWSRVIAINLSGTFFGCKRALQELVRAGQGRVVNLASVAGLIGDGGGPAYVASKHGVVGLTRQLAVSAAAHGVTVNAICPGPIQTGLRVNSAAILGSDAPPMRGVGGDEAAIKAVTPMGRRGTVEEVAATALFLAGRDAGYITGHTLVIDGGWTVR